jgi:hypothetical protein
MTLEETKPVWSSGGGTKSRLRVIWPALRRVGDREPPLFYLLDGDGNNPRSPTPVRRSFSTIGVIPVLSPLEYEEAIVEDETVRRNLSGRLSSRHFRNQLQMLVDSRDWPDLAQASAHLSRGGCGRGPR